MNNIEILNLSRDKIQFLLENHNLFYVDQVKLAAKREVIFSRERKPVNNDGRLRGITDDSARHFANLQAGYFNIYDPMRNYSGYPEDRYRNSIVGSSLL